MSHFGAVILAAGMSSRMNANKLLLPWRDGQPIVTHVVLKYVRLDIAPIIVVTGRDAAQVHAALAHLPVICRRNPDYKRGEILSSVKTGLAAMPAEAAASFIQPADMPCIPPAIIPLLAARHQPGKNVAPRCAGQRGHPILLDRAFWPAMLDLPPDAMPRDVIQAQREHLRLIDTVDDGVLFDIDTRDAYERALKRLRSRNL